MILSRIWRSRARYSSKYAGELDDGNSCAGGQRPGSEMTHGKAFEVHKYMKGWVGHTEEEKASWPRTVLEELHVHNGDAIFLEFVEQIRDAPVFAVAKVYSTL